MRRMVAPDTRAAQAALSSSRACSVAASSPSSAPSMRTISATRSSSATRATSATVVSPAARFSIVKWVVGERRDLRQVGDAEDLAGLAEPPQPLADRARGGAADPGIDLVEDDRALRLAGEAGEREHDPRDLAPGRRLLERRERHPRVRRDEQLDRLGAGRAEAVRMRLERDLEPRPVHRQLGELGRDRDREPLGGVGPARAELGGERRAPGLGLADPRAELGAQLLRVLEPAISSRQRSAWATTSSIVPPCLRFSRSSAVSRSSTCSSRPGSASIRVEIGAKLGRDVGDLERQRRDPLADRIEGRVDALDAGQAAFGGGERGRGALLVVARLRDSAASACSAPSRRPSAWRRRSRSARGRAPRRDRARRRRSRRARSGGRRARARASPRGREARRARGRAP